MSSGESIDDLVHSLLRDLEIDTNVFYTSTNIDLKKDLDELLNHSKSSRSVFFDASCFAASLGNWDLALEYCRKHMSHETETMGVQCWNMRCLVELEKYSEALALASANEWPSDMLIHTKFLSGICYFKLNMKERARVNFDFVKRQDSGYRDVAGWLLKV